MANLIVGHVSKSTARIWVRGSKKTGTALLRHRVAGSAEWLGTSGAPLLDHLGHVAVFELEGLSPATDYECELSYKTTGVSATGSFTTAPEGPRDIAFLFGSCNWTRVPLSLKRPEPAWTRIAELAASEDADFMIHCGDQIYADIPTMPLFPDVEFYRKQYRDAWEIAPTSGVLASLPNYMILDDHEIFDGYANDSEFVGRPSQPVRDVALAAYREYQHSHNPQTYPAPALYYSFGFGGAEFFVLDVRTERYHKNGQQIISALQMQRFKSWLLENATRPKFVVTSIPFVAEARDKGDKWCADGFLAQRHEVIDFLAAQGIGNLVFLTGDMHCSYHATMNVAAPDGRHLVIHELMSSPINQFGNDLHAFAEAGPRTTPGGVVYESHLDPAEFYGAHSNVTLVRLTVGGALRYSIFRTKNADPPVVTGQFQLEAGALSGTIRPEVSVTATRAKSEDQDDEKSNQAA